LSKSVCVIPISEIVISPVSIGITVIIPIEGRISIAKPTIIYPTVAKPRVVKASIAPAPTIPTKRRPCPIPGIKAPSIQKPWVVPAHSEITPINIYRNIPSSVSPCRILLIFVFIGKIIGRIAYQAIL
jgi:hypothetical protein